MSTYTGVSNFQRTVRFFWPTLYTIIIATVMKFSENVSEGAQMANIYILP